MSVPPSLGRHNSSSPRFLLHSKYNLPLVITELACIDYEIKPAYFCNQTEINAW